MSWIEPFTEWNDGYTQQPSDMNRIEGNTDYLKDAVDTEISDRAAAINSEASTRAAADTAEASTRAAADTALSSRATSLETKTPQSYKTTDAVTFSGIYLAGALSPTSAPVTGSWVVTDATPYVIPRGIYQVALGGAADLEVYVSGGWRDSVGGCVVSDGANVRIDVNAGSSTSYYLKF